MKSAYYEQHADTIDAGLNISQQVVSDKFQSLGSPGQLRQLYKDTIIGYSSIDKALESIIEHYPNQPITETTQFLLQSLSADLQASRTNPDRKVLLKNILDDLYQLKQINTINQDCGELVQKCHTLFQSEAPSNKLVLEMVGYVIKLKSAEWNGKQLIDDVMGMLKLPDFESKVYFLQGFKEVNRQLPLKVFSDEFQRTKMLDVLQQSIDQSIEQEESANV